MYPFSSGQFWAGCGGGYRRKCCFIHAGNVHVDDSSPVIFARRWPNHDDSIKNTAVSSSFPFPPRMSVYVYSSLCTCVSPASPPRRDWGGSRYHHDILMADLHSDVLTDLLELQANDISGDIAALLISHRNCKSIGSKPLYD